MEAPMGARIEDVELIRSAMAYVIELYRELSEENGAPSLGTQNQAIDFILDDPELREAVARWAKAFGGDEATTRPARRLPYDNTYRRVAAQLSAAMAPPVFRRAKGDAG
jgi:hypothetical protein